MQYNDLPMDLKVFITNLFTQRNFCFATAKPGRSPTFYFAKGGLSELNTSSSCGRLRTNHPSGPLIDISTRPKGHLFFVKKSERDEVRNNVRNAKPIARKHEMNIAAAKYRTTPKEGDYHFEYSKDPNDPLSVTRRHPSGGTVLLNPRPTHAQMVALIDRLLDDNCQITIDRQVRRQLGHVPHRMIVGGLGPYLASL